MKKESPKTVVIIAGPTAAGKTAVAAMLAQDFSTAVISADSRQCFRELSIGVARPDEAELAIAPHYFIGSHSILDEVTAATFEIYALNKTAELFQEHDVVIMTGGTGLYIRAFTKGLDEAPATDPDIRKKFSLLFEEKGITGLQEAIRIKDPLFYEKGEIQNPQRLMRALEVATISGQSILSFRNEGGKERDFNIIKIGLELPREILRERIANRVHAMIKAGLPDEVKSLLPYRNLNALQTVGYTELFEFLDGKISQDEAVNQIINHTRQYAKRQMTWFKREEGIVWFNPADYAGIKNYILEKINQ